MTNPLLEVSDLSVEFESYEGTHRVLNDVDLTIEEGETVALVGETGCGKSVTAKSIMGTLPRPPGKITSGNIRYRGTDLLANRAEHDRVKGEEMSMIFQDPMTYLSPVYTVGSMMADVATYSGNADVSWFDVLKNLLGRREERESIRERSIELLERMHLPDPEGALDKYPVQLSGGMRQRVIIAMALINEPTFLLADEPTTALDVTVQNQILDLLREHVTDRNLSMLYITHNLGVAREIADKICIMYAGEIVEVGSTDEIFDAPLHPYTRGLLDSIPKLTGFEGDGIDGQIPDYTNPPRGCRFHPRCPAAIAGTCDSEPVEAHAVGESRSVGCHLYEDGMSMDDAMAVATSDATYWSEERPPSAKAGVGSASSGTGTRETGGDQ
ncbi:ABC transporter ATP-binding protein (plasmid) [Haloferax mediterranei ATCC 33500]|uniref:Nickel import system ATP-binding protein NikD n=1 Tax=Haloferax mediterranei (strain ATCC 33500 / DSM 1411 / JCM 8866 / NBRC 14739 / NCIMB 2177 / R-4) TaxID=523841 RepID=I3R9X0_HALMT|nr:ABC transporter ATP-binding protein [Haloferax mediterranei]AFK21030.1 dipeptide/oligopeptide/nickel ABC transporter ATP-binding protein [Haloferax mediterranei ATCC 33500]AHZ24109.1 peptide ABC transporter ATPase [Haloferax mediterranei ATCC 33500]EMA05184.1 dipeptide/oligopeptide/nickel ABC transporter ATP-binding protein [Haloferax mediterranei ATCC 33500]MDX5990008.1 ABC transporter ATP-binding protein [Haloferax mediterranei ATCC 33500]QCQ77191.1 ABC transporter ATP-binding protein [Ha